MRHEPDGTSWRFRGRSELHQRALQAESRRCRHHDGLSASRSGGHSHGLLILCGRIPTTACYWSTESRGTINVEDLKLLDTKTMQQSPQFKDLRVQFPQVDVWPGDRDGKTWPNSQTGPDGGIQFTVAYPLINGCHACAHAGSALFTWNFSAQGKFLGTTFVGMTPPPL